MYENIRVSPLGHEYAKYLKNDLVPLSYGMFFYIVLTPTKMKIPTTSAL